MNDVFVAEEWAHVYVRSVKTLRHCAFPESVFAQLYLISVKHSQFAKRKLINYHKRCSIPNNCILYILFEVTMTKKSEPSSRWRQ